jgi:hypothetical protein
MRKLCVRHGLHDVEVIVFWSNALRPAIQISVDALLRHAVPIIAADFDTWIISKAKGWCIEVYHEGELCFGYASKKGRDNKNPAK